MIGSGMKKFISNMTGTEPDEVRAPEKKKQKLATIVELDEPAAAFPDEPEEGRPL